MSMVGTTWALVLKKLPCPMYAGFNKGVEDSLYVRSVVPLPPGKTPASDDGREACPCPCHPRRRARRRRHMLRRGALRRPLCTRSSQPTQCHGAPLPTSTNLIGERASHSTTHDSTKLPLLPSPPPPTQTRRHRRRRRRRDLPKQLTADRKNNKSERIKVVQVSVRPGIEFQSLVLRDLCSDVVTPEPNSNSGAFWITPPFHSPRFSAVSISNMLSFFLCAPPHRVRASAVEPSVFCARVASENVASFILHARRELKLHKCIFTLHASLPEASAMAGQLREEEDFTPSHPPLPGVTEPSSNSCAVVLGARGGVDVDLKRLDVERSPNLATVPSDSTRTMTEPGIFFSWGKLKTMDPATQPEEQSEVLNSLFRVSPISISTDQDGDSGDSSPKKDLNF